MTNVRFLATTVLLAVAMAFYALTVSDDGMLSGSGNVSRLLNSLPILSF